MTAGFTPEQIADIQKFFENNDFTSFMSVERRPAPSGKEAVVFKKAKDIFKANWLKNLLPLGVKRPMKNFSNDFPIRFLQNMDGDEFAEKIAHLHEDDEEFKKALDTFFEMYGDQIYAGLESYSKNYGRKIEDLTDDEIVFVVEKVSEVLDEELIKVLMLGQKVPEVFAVSRSISTQEDFNVSLPKNLDLINHHNKWTHCKTKLGAPLLFCELSEEEATGIEGAKSFFESADAHTQKEYEEIRDSFAETLNSTDREIYYLREMGYTLKEIASRLGYKSHSSVAKRLNAMSEKFKEFTGYIETNYQKTTE